MNKEQFDALYKQGAGPLWAVVQNTIGEAESASHVENNLMSDSLRDHQQLVDAAFAAAVPLVVALPDKCPQKALLTDLLNTVGTPIVERQTAIIDAQIKELEERKASL